MVTILHFADAHIDMANYGRHDPDTGLPLRVMDFLKSLDTIVDTAIEEEVDLVLFARCFLQNGYGFDMEGFTFIVLALNSVIVTQNSQTLGILSMLLSKYFFIDGVGFLEPL